MLNGKVSPSLTRDEYYLEMFQQNGVNVETLPSWMYEKLESTYNDYLANDADEDFRVREEAMDLWYNSTGFMHSMFNFSGDFLWLFSPLLLEEGGKRFLEAFFCISTNSKKQQITNS